jgi:predicted dehydrogenase
MNSTDGQAIDIVVIGCGYIAIAEHIPSILTSRNARLRAAVEPRADMRAAVATRYGVPVYGSVAEMTAAGTRVRAAVICSGPLSHAALIEEAFAADLDVLVEKPLCHSVTEGSRLVEAAARTGRKLMVGYMRRYDDDVLEARKLIASGAIGEVRAIHTVFKLALGPHYSRPFDIPPRPGRPEPEAGPPDLLPDDQIINQSLHQINLIRFIGGEIVGISGVQKSKSAVHILFDLERGVPATHAHVNGMGHGEELTVYGEYGRIDLKLWSPHIPYQFPELRLFDKRDRSDKLIHTARLNPYLNEVEEFCRVVAGAGENRSPAADAVRDLRVIEAIHRVHGEKGTSHAI